MRLGTLLKTLCIIGSLLAPPGGVGIGGAHPQRRGTATMKRVSCDVAIKVSAERFCERFEREARAIAL
jgi:hypothetical protein